MGEKFANNAVSTLATGIAAIDTSMTVDTGDGALWPTLGDGDWCWTTLASADGSLVEIVRVTARAGDVFTIERAQQGTAAQAWSAGTIVALRITRSTLEALQAPKLVLGTGWTINDFLDSDDLVLNGAESMTIAVLLRFARVEDEAVSKTVIANGAAFFGGYRVAHLQNRPELAQYWTSTGAKTSTGFAAPDFGPGSAASFNYVDYKTALLIGRVSAGTMTMFVNTISWRTIGPYTGYVAGSNGMRIGSDHGAPGSNPFTGGGIAGWGYIESALTDDQVRELAVACTEAADLLSLAEALPGDGLNWATRVSFKQLGLRHGDSVPATVTDLDGANDFTRTGALSIVEERPRWI